MASSRLVTVRRIGKKGVDSGFVAGGSIGSDAAGKSENWFAVLFGSLCHADGGFAKDGLSVQAAFAGNDKVGVFYIVSEAGFLQDDLNAGLQFSMKKGQKSEA